jgi:hypothetical protein
MFKLEVNNSTTDTIKKSFDQIADNLFNNFQLLVNESYYRLLDIEFYYNAEGVHDDIYAHKHEAQLLQCKWYVHGSGIDITIGNGINHGGILIRGIAKLFGDATPEKNYIQKQIHGPLNVKTELCSNFHEVFDKTPNTLYLNDISTNKEMMNKQMPTYFYKTKRIGLNPTKDNAPGKYFYEAKYRYVIFPHLGLKDKTQIALDMQIQFPELSKDEINKKLGSKFL